MITFYFGDEVPYGPFSNFSLDPIEAYGRSWLTSEHAYQAWKFHPHRPDLVDKVAAAQTPKEAKKIGNDRSLPMRGDWEMHPQIEMVARVYGTQPDDGLDRQGAKAEPLFVRVKDVVMFDVVYAKFSKSAELKKLLVSTGTESLVENSDRDPYWGWGAKRTGENKLGRILMAVRRKLSVGS